MQVNLENVHEARNLVEASDEVSEEMFDSIEMFSGVIEDAVADLTELSSDTFSFVVCEVLCGNAFVKDIVKGVSELQLKEKIKGKLLGHPRLKGTSKIALVTIAYILAVAIAEVGIHALCSMCEDG